MACNNGFLMGSSTITTTNTVVALNNQSYTGFTFNGNCILDSIEISNILKTDVEVIATSISTLPDWTPDVKFLASFNNTLDASNVFGMVDSPTSWSLYRRIYQGDILTKICDCSPEITSWVDWKCEGNQEYEWLIFANSGTQVSEPIITDSKSTSFFGYFMIENTADFITSADATNLTPLIANSVDAEINNLVQTYKFELNLESDKIMSNNDVIYQKNYSDFDVCVIGNRNFRSGSFTCMIIPQDPITGIYDFEGLQRWATYLDDLRTFLHNKTYKYMKLMTGDIMKIISEGNGSTSDTKHSRGISVGGKYNKQNQQMDVSIYYTEIGDVD